MSIKIYHNPRCKKSRAGKQFLEDNNIDFEVVEYIKNPFTEEELKKLLLKLNLQPHEIIRTQEEIVKRNFKNKGFTGEEWIKIMIENPRIIQRPIVESRYKAVIGDPVENINKVL
jgi:arsenate reductase